MINYQKYKFNCTWTSDAIMPSYWGSALRGGLGKWLRKTSCVLRSARCDGCVVRSSCAYGFIFETEKTSGKNVRNINARPHPIVLEPPVPSPKDTRAGKEFSFSVILMDNAVEFLPHVVYSFLKLGNEDGLGARSKQGCGRFLISSLSCGNEIIYGVDRSGLEIPHEKRCLELSGNGTSPCNNLEVSFETPFRVKYRGLFSEKIPFHLLVRVALRRISSLEQAYGQGEPALDYPGLVAAAERVETVNEDLEWKEVPRFSSRQKSRMMIGGSVGRVAYRGSLENFLPLLRYCETVHAGKQTFFGLGKIRLGV